MGLPWTNALNRNASVKSRSVTDNLLKKRKRCERGCMLVLFTSSTSHIHGLLIDTKVNDVNGVMAIISRANCIKIIKVKPAYTLWGEKTAPLYFCNNFVKSFCVAIIIGTLYHNKFGTKWYKNHHSFGLWNAANIHKFWPMSVLSRRLKSDILLSWTFKWNVT